ncbi:hypothetical protein [Limnospira platensis]|uniref:hypothetical protein n=1 Tax=Limnospira platensis TaxID=118562 RepID=UPI0012683DDE
MTRGKDYQLTEYFWEPGKTRLWEAKPGWGWFSPEWEITGSMEKLLVIYTLTDRIANGILGHSCDRLICGFG